MEVEAKWLAWLAYDLKAMGSNPTSTHLSQRNSYLQIGSMSAHLELK